MKGRGRRRFVLALIVLSAALVPLIFFEWHSIEGMSMWPAFRDGDQLIVRRGSERPERFAPVVVEAPGLETRTVLKRAVAFGGERVLIVEGDVLIDGKRPPRTLDQILAMRCPLVGLRDLQDRQRGDRRLLTDSLGREALRALKGGVALSDDGTHLRLKSGAVPGVGNGAARLRWPATTFRDDHPGPRGRWVEGKEVVRDLIVTFALSDLEGTGRLLLEHHDGAGTLARLEVQRRGAAWRLRMSGNGEEERELERIAPLDATLRWILVDATSALQIQGEAGGFETLSEGSRQPPEAVTSSWLEIAVEGPSATFAHLDIERDIHYTSPQTEGVHGVRSPFRVPAGQVFTLGDNSPESRDSRHWGAVEIAHDFVGRPFAVVWPRSRAGFAH